MSVGDVQAAQRRRALAVANQHRMELAELRSLLRSDPRMLRRVLSDPPECVRRMPLVDVLRMVRGFGRRAEARIGERAVQARVNLLLPVGEAGPRVRDWVSENGLAWARLDRSGL